MDGTLLALLCLGAILGVIVLVLVALAWCRSAGEVDDGLEVRDGIHYS